jgi:hypothetical protein
MLALFPRSSKQKDTLCNVPTQQEQKKSKKIFVDAGEPAPEDFEPEELS